jgi:hypothetical protein
MSIVGLSIFYCVLQFLSLRFYSFYCKGHLACGIRATMLAYVLCLLPTENIKCYLKIVSKVDL